MFRWIGVLAVLLIGFLAISEVDVSPMVGAPPPLDQESTTEASILPQDEIDPNFPNKDILFYGYYGVGNFVPKMDEVQRIFPDRMAAAFERVYPGQGYDYLTLKAIAEEEGHPEQRISLSRIRKVRSHLAITDFDGASQVGTHSNFLDIRIQSPNRKERIDNFLKAAARRLRGADNPVVRIVNGKEVRYQGSVILALHFLWDWHTRALSGNEVGIRLRRYGEENQLPQASTIEVETSEGLLRLDDSRTLFERLAEEKLYEMGLDGHLDDILFLDSIDEPYLHSDESPSEVERIYQDMLIVNDAMKNIFARVTHCFAVNQGLELNKCKYASIFYPEIGHENLGQGRRATIRTNFSAATYEKNDKIKVPPNSDIISYDCYGEPWRQNIFIKPCEGKTLQEHIAFLRSKMTCDQELFLVPEAWSWQKNVGDKRPTQRQIYDRTAYHWDTMLMDDGIVRRDCAGKVNKIIGFAMFLWNSMDWDGSGTFSPGTVSPYFSVEITNRQGEKTTYHKLIKEITDMIFGYANRRLLIPSLSDRKFLYTERPPIHEVVEEEARPFRAHGVNVGNVYIPGLSDQADKTEKPRDEVMAQMNRKAPTHSKVIPINERSGPGGELIIENEALVPDESGTGADPCYDRTGKMRVCSAYVPNSEPVSDFVQSNDDELCQSEKARIKISGALLAHADDGGIYMESTEEGCTFRVNHKGQLFINGSRANKSAYQ